MLGDFDFQREEGIRRERPLLIPAHINSRIFTFHFVPIGISIRRSTTVVAMCVLKYAEKWIYWSDMLLICNLHSDFSEYDFFRSGMPLTHCV